MLSIARLWQHVLLQLTWELTLVKLLWSVHAVGITDQSKMASATAPAKTSTKRILVTGGSGFIGSHTVLELLQKGYEVPRRVTVAAVV